MFFTGTYHQVGTSWSKHSSIVLLCIVGDAHLFDIFKYVKRFVVYCSSLSKTLFIASLIYQFLSMSCHKNFIFFAASFKIRKCIGRDYNKNIMPKLGVPAKKNVFLKWVVPWTFIHSKHLLCHAYFFYNLIDTVRSFFTRWLGYKNHAEFIRQSRYIQISFCNSLWVL